MNINYLVIFVIGVSCGPAPSPSNAGRSASVGGNCQSANPPQSCQKKNSDTALEKIGEEYQDDDPDIIEPSGYLYSLNQAALINPLVESLERVAAEPESFKDETSRYASLSKYLRNFANRLLKKKALAPGRVFRVHVINSDEANAFADGDQNIAINVGYIENRSEVSTLATICHEIAHSTRNHVAKIDKIYTSKNSADLEKVSAEIDDYLEKNYNKTSGVYTHRQSQFLSILSKWNVASRELSIQSKRMESEADIVGAAICAQAGMPVSVFIDGYREEAEENARLLQQSESYTGKDLNNGEQLEISEDELYTILFPLDSHPQDQERLDQLERVKDAAEKYFVKSETLYNDWMNNYSGTKGVGLFDAYPSNVTKKASKVVVTSDGREIVLKGKHSLLESVIRGTK